MAKRFSAFLLAFLFVLPLIPALPASAEDEYYGLKVAGVMVSTYNRSDILHDGAFSYDPDSRVLTVAGNCLCKGELIVSMMEELTIYVASDSTLHTDSIAIDTAGDLTVTGPGKLTVKALTGIGAGPHANVTVEDADVDFRCDFYGLTTLGKPSSEKLTVRRSSVHASGNKRAIGTFGSIVLDECEIYEPVGGAVSDGNVVDENGKPATDVVIGPPTFDLWVGAQIVSEANLGDILGDGNFSYDPEGKVLTVRGDFAPGKNVIISRIDGLTIYVEEDSTLDSGIYAGIYTDRDLTITGPGKLTILSGDVCILARAGVTVTLDRANVEAYGGNAGFAGDSTHENVVIKNSNVYVDGGKAAFAFFLKITFEGCGILEPENCVIHNGTVTDEKYENVIKNLTIGRTYDLRIAGTQVTDLNRTDVLNDGNFSYNRGRNILTVRGDCAAVGQSVVDSGIDGLRIFAEEDASLSSDDVALVFRADTAITGPGKLTLNGKSAGIFVRDGASLTVGSDLAVSGGNGIMGISPASGEKLAFRYCDVSVAASGDGAIFNFSEITLDGCAITVPEGGKIDGGYILNGDGSTAKTVAIELERYDLFLAGEQVTAANAADVFGDGVFSYNPRETTLTVSGDCAVSGSNVIRNRIQYLKINVASDSTLSSDRAVVVSANSVLITGPGKLTLNSSGNSGIYASDGAVIRIANVDVEIAGKYGIAGYSSGEGLVIYRSNVRVKGTDGAILDFDGGISIGDSFIMYPVDASVGENAVLYRSGIIARDVTIRKVSDLRNENLFMYVEDVYTVSGKGTVVEGKILRGTVKVGDTVLIETVEPGTSVPETVATTVKAISKYGKSLDMAEAGDGIGLRLSENVTAADVEMGDAVIAENSAYPRVVAHETVNPNGYVYGILEKFERPLTPIEDGQYVYIHTNMDVKAQVVLEDDASRLSPGETANAFIQDFARSVTLFEGEELAVRDGNGNFIAKFTVTEFSETPYPLTVAGEPVTLRNKNDVLGDGVFSYSPSTKTLTVQGSFDCEDVLIENGIPGLTVYTAVDSMLTSYSSSAIRTSADIRITGPGWLSLVSVSAPCIEATAGSYVTAADASLIIAGDYGIIGKNGGEVLIVKNSNVYLDTDSGAVNRFDGGISLAGCSVIYPEAAEISNGGIYDKDGNIALTVGIERDASALSNPFVDVKEGEYYYDAVLWAVNHNPQITKGTDETHFSPNKTCTRAQVVTFLWRAIGEPEPSKTENPFSDVKEGDYFCKAVLWAVENGITKGVSATKFGPNEPCTRAQVVTFLWRAEGEPKPSKTENPFSDVKSGAYYFDAVLWAVENDITKGTSATKFSPDNPCTRGQIVTFLYRDFN